MHSLPISTSCSNGFDNTRMKRHSPQALLDILDCLALWMELHHHPILGMKQEHHKRSIPAQIHTKEIQKATSFEHVALRGARPTSFTGSNSTDDCVCREATGIGKERNSKRNEPWGRSRAWWSGAHRTTGSDPSPWQPSCRCRRRSTSGRSRKPPPPLLPPWSPTTTTTTTYRRPGKSQNPIFLFFGSLAKTQLELWLVRKSSFIFWQENVYLFKIRLMPWKILN